MNCKYCNAPLEAEETLCPVCGKEQSAETLPETAEIVPETEAIIPEAEETTPEAGVCEEASQEVECPCCEAEQTDAPAPAAAPTKKRKAWKVVLVTVACLLVAAIIAGAVMYALGVNPFADAILSRSNYTVTEDKTGELAQTVVAVAGDEQLTNSQLQFYYWDVVNNYISYYGSSLSLMGLDTSKPLEEQVMDQKTGKTWQHFFLENALESWHRSASVVLLAGEAEHKISEAEQETIDTIGTLLEELAATYQYASVEELIRSQFGSLSDINGYRDFVKTDLTGNSYFATLYDGMIPTAEEVEAHYNKNEATFVELGAGKDAGKAVDVRHILLKPETTDGFSSDAQWEACRVAAQKLLDEFLAGEATEEAFAELAVKHSTDPGSASNGGLYEQVQLGQMVDPFEDWCFDESRKEGDTGLVKTTYGYHIMYYVGGRGIWFSAAENDLINTRVDEFIVSGMKRWPMTVDYNKIAIGQL